MAQKSNCPGCGSPLAFGLFTPSVECPRCHRRVSRAETRDTLAPSSPPNPTPANPDGAGGLTGVWDLVRAGNKFEAIVAYRALTGVGLKEAKDAVDDMARQAGIT